MKKTLIAFLILSCLFVSCDKDEIEEFNSSIIGVLVDESGNKLANTYVYLLQNDSVLFIDTTSLTGDFIFEHLKAGGYKLLAYHSDLKKSDTLDIEIQPNSILKATFTFLADLSVSGIFVGYFNEIQANKTISLTDYNTKNIIEYATTDSKGRFNFYCIKEGSYILTYTTPGGRDITRVVHVVPDETQDIYFSLGYSGTFTDVRDNHLYRWVKIGNQTWLAENLAYLPKIDHVSDGSEDLGHSTGKYYYVYSFTPAVADAEDVQVEKAKQTSYYKSYGVLYSWPAAMNESDASGNNPSGVQGACPDGWHLPSVSEYTELSNFVNNDNHGAPSGRLLKSVGNTSSGTGLWYSYGIDGIDEYKMAFVPGGYRDYNSYFGDLSYYNYFWTTNQASSTYGYFYYLGYYSNYMNYTYSYKGYGFSVRCVKDVSE